jgi:hypothetical protein
MALSAAEWLRDPATGTYSHSVPQRRLLACKEETKRMTGWIEHDPDARRVAVWWLPKGDISASFERCRDGSLDVIDLDLEVEHLCLIAGLSRPRRRFIPAVALNVEVHAAQGFHS